MMTFILICVLGIYVLWLFYLAVMNLKRSLQAGNITKTAKVLGYPILFVGLFLDFLINLIPMTIIFLELPKEMTVTARLKKHIYLGSGWRESVAAWFCGNLLDPFDPSGSHCRGPK